MTDLKYNFFRFVLCKNSDIIWYNLAFSIVCSLPFLFITHAHCILISIPIIFVLTGYCTITIQYEKKDYFLHEYVIRNLETIEIDEASILNPYKITLIDGTVLHCFNTPRPMVEFIKCDKKFVYYNFFHDDAVAVKILKLCENHLTKMK